MLQAKKNVLGAKRMRILVASFVVAMSAGAWSQEPAKAVPAPPAAKTAAAEISDILAPLPKRFDVPAVAALVIRGDEIVAQGVAGVRENGKDSPATLDDKWHLGSCTKSMTATLMAILVNEGKLKWTTTIGEVFGDIKDFDPAWKDVTVRQLLAHRAGVPSDLSADGLWGKLWNHDGMPVEQRLTLVRGILTKKPVHAPGTKFLYANAGFAIAGAMAEKITGQSWEEMITHKLFEPLKITTAGFGAPGTPNLLDQPRGHEASHAAQQPGPHHAADNPAAIAPGGTVHMSLPDWGKYVAMHLAGERGEDRIIPSAAIAALHRAYESQDEQRYGWGWSMTTRDWAGAGKPGEVFTHNGSNNLWFCVTWVAPRKNLAALVVCNQGGDAAAKVCDEIASKLVTRFIRDAPELVEGK